MTNEKKICYKEIGDVLYRRNPRARNIAIRINSEGLVRVTVPGGCKIERAEKFVIEKGRWIVQKKEKIRQNRRENLLWEPGAIVNMLHGRIFIEQGTGDGFEVFSVGNSYSIQVPKKYNSSDPMFEKAVYEHIALIGKKEGKLQLPEVLSQCAKTYNLPYTKVTVRRMKTRWGSCSSKNNISLNSSLIFIPEELVRYVCLHELVHTIHKNHGRVFWDALTGILPEALMFRKELRKQTIIA
jgi:predicted metal-dependent hydrolase